MSSSTRSVYQLIIEDYIFFSSVLKSVLEKNPSAIGIPEIEINADKIANIDKELRQVYNGPPDQIDKNKLRLTMIDLNWYAMHVIKRHSTPDAYKKWIYVQVLPENMTAKTLSLCLSKSTTIMELLSHMVMTYDSFAMTVNMSVAAEVLLDKAK